MNSQRSFPVVIALWLGLILPAGGLFAQGNPQVDQFLANPNQVLQQYPNGGPELISLMRDAAVAHPEALQMITNLLGSSNEDQQAAIGSGLGQASQIVVRSDQAYAGQIQAALGASNSDSAKTAFAGVTGDTSIASTGGPGGGGGGGGGGGVGGPTGYTNFPGGGSNSGSGGTTGGGGTTSSLTGGGGGGGGGGNGSAGGTTSLAAGGTINTDAGDFTDTDGIATINVSGGTVTVNVLTGHLEFTNKQGNKSTVNAGDTAQVEDGAVTRLMHTTDALKSDDSAFAQVTQQSLLTAVSAVAALSKNQPDNAQLRDLLTTLVTQASQLAADSGDTTLLTNIVAFAVANAPAGQKDAIVQAANNGITNSTATDKGSLNNLVSDSAAKGSEAGAVAAAPTTQQTTDESGHTVTTIVMPVDPSQVAIISPSS